MIRQRWQSTGSAISAAKKPLKRNRLGGDFFLSDTESNIARFEDVKLNDEIMVLARKGRDDTVIGRLADGRAILFSKDTTFDIKPGDTVIGETVHISARYIIVKPLRVLGDSTEALIENLKNVASSGYYQHAILAKALLFLMSKTFEGV